MTWLLAWLTSNALFVALRFWVVAGDPPRPCEEDEA